MKKKLIYADTYSYEGHHEIFNASSLKMLSLIYDKVTYIASRSSYKASLTQLKEMPFNVNYKAIHMISENRTSIQNFYNHIVSSLYNIIIILFARKNTTIFINYNSLFGLPVINFILKFKKVGVIIMCHGELAQKDSDINVLFKSVLKYMFSESFHPSETLYFCVLGEGIKANLQKLLPIHTFNKFLSFEHTILPIPSKECQKQYSNIIKIATVGVIDESKGLLKFINIKNEICRKRPDEFEFYCLGRIRCDVNVLIQNDINIIPGSDKSFVPRYIMDEYIDKMDCIVFLYNTGTYKLTASGALLDVINHEKYVIALHNDYFDSIYKYFSFGKLFDSEQDILSFLLNFDRNDLSSISYKENKKFLSPESQACFMKIKLKENNLL